MPAPKFLRSTACLFLWACAAGAQENSLEAGRTAFDKGDYSRAIEILKAAAAKDPASGDLQLFLARSYLELHQADAAISTAEKAVAINPQSSAYHQWLGEAYGEKASHASMFSAYPLARKTQKEFETAVQLDEKNYPAAQDLVDYDCTAPGVVGGGEDKAQPIIARLLVLDPAQGHYAAGNCKAQKKDFPAADAEFSKALASKPKSANIIYDMADFYLKHDQPEKLILAVDAGEAAAPADPRARFYRAVVMIQRNENLSAAETLLRDYLHLAPVKSGYPSPSQAHYQLGLLYEKQKNSGTARAEYQTAVRLNDKNKAAQEALKRLGKQ
jgi:tetratricopeptide (TPR) repeat protein